MKQVIVNFYVNAESNDDRRSSSDFGANTKAKYPTKLDLNHDCVCDLTYKRVVYGFDEKSRREEEADSSQAKVCAALGRHQEVRP